uniref:Ground-like domain-containing protein n=1 Tax=Parascaris univalens TaxID=6257 RepID=A0A915BS50_PARUN
MKSWVMVLLVFTCELRCLVNSTVGRPRNPECPPPPPVGPPPVPCSERSPLVDPTTDENKLCTSVELRSAILLSYSEDAVDTVSRIYDAARTIDNKAVVTVLCAPASALKFKVQSIRYCAAGSPELMCFVSLT